MNERGPNVMVEIYDDRIEIYNPGGLPKGLPSEEFSKRSVLRNPRIAGMLHRADYIEKMGTGVRKMQRPMSEAGLALLEFTFMSFFKVTFRKPNAQRGEVTDEDFATNLGADFAINGKANDIVNNITTLKNEHFLGERLANALNLRSEALAG